MFNIFRDTIAKDLTKIADYFNAVADAGVIFKDKRGLAINRIKNAVLNGDIGGGGVTPEIEAEIENAQWKTETSTPLFSETVTTVDEGDTNEATLSYAEQITADTLKITFNGVEYTCTKVTFEVSDEVYYGAPFNPETDSFDFSEYPFHILSSPLAANIIRTESAGTYTVSASSDVTTYTSAFVDGVKKNSAFIVHFYSDAEAISADKTVQEIGNAYNKGFIIIGIYENNVGYNEVYYLQDIYAETGAVTFVKFSISVSGTVVSASINCIKSDPEDVNSFIVAEKVLS